MNEKLAKASKLVSARLRKDESLWISYQANIAMSFVDACGNYKKKECKTYLNRRDIHRIANVAAHNFLALLTTPIKDDKRKDHKKHSV